MPLLVAFLVALVTFAGLMISLWQVWQVHHFFIQPNLAVLGTKPPLVLVLRIREDLGDASLGGLLGGLLGWPLRRLRPHWRCATTATTRTLIAMCEKVKPCVLPAFYAHVLTMQYGSNPFLKLHVTTNHISSYSLHLWIVSAAKIQSIGKKLKYCGNYLNLLQFINSKKKRKVSAETISGNS